MVNFREIVTPIPLANYAVDVPIHHIERHLAEYATYPYGLDLEPDFQRSHVWNTRQREQYVEWILKEGQSGRDIYFNCPGWDRGEISGPIVLVDGLQRLTSLRMFVDNKLRAFGYYIKELDNMPLLNYLIRMHVFSFSTRAEVLQWYLDINSGGVVHSDEEIVRVRKLLEKEQGR